VKRVLALLLAVFLTIDTIEDLIIGETLGFGAGKTASGRRITMDYHPVEYSFVIIMRFGMIIALFGAVLNKEENEDD